jgi:hypothetical protein
MRELETIPHPSMRISILQMNQRFQVRFEAGFMEQIYKFDTETCPTLNELKKKITPEFIESVRNQFNSMYLLYK